MSTTEINVYPFDPVGNNPANKITTPEAHTITMGPNNGFRFIIPRKGPFHENSIKIKSQSTGEYLVKNQDYVPSYFFMSATEVSGTSRIYGSISILNNAFDNSTLIIEEYQTLGAEFVLDYAEITTILANTLIDPLIVYWDNILNKPLTYAPSAHLHNVATQTMGYDDLVVAVDRLADNFSLESSRLMGTLMAHIEDHLNPHEVTLEQLGILRLQNVYRATLEEAIEGLNNLNYVTPYTLVETIKRVAGGDSANVLALMQWREIIDLAMTGNEGEVPFFVDSSEPFNVTADNIVKSLLIAIDADDLTNALTWSGSTDLYLVDTITSNVYEWNGTSYVQSTTLQFKDVVKAGRIYKDPRYVGGLYVGSNNSLSLLMSRNASQSDIESGNAINWITAAQLNSFISDLNDSLESVITWKNRIDSLTIGTKGQLPFFKNDLESFNFDNDFILQNLLIATSSADLANARTYRENFANVFNTWNRYSIQGSNLHSNSYEEQGFVYDADTDKIECTINSTRLLIFSSPDPIKGDYVFEVEASSSSVDDDFIGVSLGTYTNQQNQNYTLTLMRSAGENDFTPNPANPTSNATLSLWVARPQDTSLTFPMSLGHRVAHIGNLSRPATALGWSGYATPRKVKVRKVGSMLYFTTNDTTDDYLPEHSFDLSSTTSTSYFIDNANNLGYACYSQDRATWKTIQRTGANPTILSLFSNQVYEWNGTSYALSSTATLANTIKLGRFYKDIRKAGSLYYARDEGQLLTIMSSEATRDEVIEGTSINWISTIQLKIAIDEVKALITNLSNGLGDINAWKTRLDNTVIGNKGQLPFFKNDLQSFNVDPDFVTRNLLIATSAADLANARTYRENFASVFNTWNRYSISGRFLHASVSDESRFTYDSDADLIRSTVNASVWLTFLSPEKVSGDYTFEVELSSANQDDDFIGIYLGTLIDPVTNDNISLILSRSARHVAQTTGANGADMRLFTPGSPGGGSMGNPLVTADGLLSYSDGWKGYYDRGMTIKLKVVKVGSVITCYTNDTTDEYTVSFTFNLLSNPSTAPFATQDVSLGYTCYSQHGATWKTIQRTGANPPIVNIPENNLYEWDGTDFTVSANPISSVVDVGRFYKDIRRTGGLYYAVADGTLVKYISSEATAEDLELGNDSYITAAQYKILKDELPLRTSSTWQRNRTAFVENDGVLNVGQEIRLHTLVSNAAVRRGGLLVDANRVGLTDASGNFTAYVDNNGILQLPNGSNSGSDISLKNNIIDYWTKKPIATDLNIESPDDLPFCSWIWKDNEAVYHVLRGRVDHGYIAQHVRLVFPHCVNYIDGVHLGIDYTKLAIALNSWRALPWYKRAIYKLKKKLKWKV